MVDAHVCAQLLDGGDGGVSGFHIVHLIDAHNDAQEMAHRQRTCYPRPKQGRPHRCGGVILQSRVGVDVFGEAHAGKGLYCLWDCRFDMYRIYREKNY